MKKILFVTENQFGYLTDTYYICKYLREKLKIYVVCQDENKKRKDLEKIKVFYEKIGDNCILKHLKLIYRTLKIIKKEEIDILFVDRFRFCLLFLLFINNKKIILDIRTISISKTKIKRFLNDLELRLSVIFFKNISVINKETAKKLKIKKYYILPLGAEKLIENIKEKNEINLFYIGTLYLRNIEQTVEGVYYFIQKYKIKNMKYFIIGDGLEEEVSKLKEYIKKYKLEDYILFLGRKEHNEIKDILEKCKIGVAFIPKTEYFMYQPPTKIYEYLVNGLICLATSTEANKKLINSFNGKLCEDNSLDFFKKLEEIYLNIHSYSNIEISRVSEVYSWKKIVDNYFMKILKSLNSDNFK